MCLVLIIFFRVHGIARQKFVQQGQTVNQHRYVDFLQFCGRVGDADSLQRGTLAVGVCSTALLCLQEVLVWPLAVGVCSTALLCVQEVLVWPLMASLWSCTLFWHPVTFRFFQNFKNR
jgi:hypothetical protein